MYPSLSSSPVLISCMFVEQHLKPENWHWYNTQSLLHLSSLTRIYLVLCHFITCIYVTIINYSQDTELHYHRLLPTTCLCKATYPSPIPNPWQPLICYSLLLFCYFKNVNKWNRTLNNLLRLAFFFFFLSRQHNSFEIHPTCYLYHLFILFYCWVIRYGIEIPPSV